MMVLNMKKLLVILALAVILTGCTDPEKVARARAIERESEAMYLATATAVAVEARATEVAVLAMATAQADAIAVREATRDDRVAFQENLLWWSTVSLIVLLLAIVASLSVVGIGGATAVSRQMQLRSRLVYLSKSTRTWPVLIDTKSGLIVDLETGERAKLDSIQALDHRRLVISGQARVTGLLAQSAERIAKDTKDAKPGDMLPAIGMSVPMLSSGEDENDGS